MDQDESLIFQANVFPIHYLAADRKAEYYKQITPEHILKAATKDNNKSNVLVQDPILENEILESNIQIADQIPAYKLSFSYKFEPVSVRVFEIINANTNEYDMSIIVNFLQRGKCSTLEAYLSNQDLFAMLASWKNKQMSIDFQKIRNNLLLSNQEDDDLFFTIPDRIQVENKEYLSHYSSEIEEQITLFLRTGDPPSQQVLVKWVLWRLIYDEDTNKLYFHFSNEQMVPIGKNLLSSISASHSSLINNNTTNKNFVLKKDTMKQNSIISDEEKSLCSEDSATSSKLGPPPSYRSSFEKNSSTHTLNQPEKINDDLEFEEEFKEGEEQEQRHMEHLYQQLHHTFFHLQARLNSEHTNKGRNSNNMSAKRYDHDETLLDESSYLYHLKKEKKKVMENLESALDKRRQVNAIRKSRLVSNIKKMNKLRSSQNQETYDNRKVKSLTKEIIDLNELLELAEKEFKCLNNKIVQDRQRITRLKQPLSCGNRRGKWMKGPLLGDGPLPAAATSKLRKPKAGGSQRQSFKSYDKDGRLKEEEKSEEKDLLCWAIDGMERIAATELEHNYALKKLYSYLDVDRDHRVTFADFEQAINELMKKYFPHKSHLDKRRLVVLFKFFDPNLSGSINYGEFVCQFFKRHKFLKNWINRKDIKRKERDKRKGEEQEISRHMTKIERELDGNIKRLEKQIRKAKIANA